jgi:hypothetical protein
MKFSCNLVHYARADSLAVSPEDIRFDNVEEVLLACYVPSGITTCMRSHETERAKYGVVSPA